MTTHNVEIDQVTQALNTPLLSEERRALDAKWANHLHHDGTIYPTITSACRFGSVLRDDVCHPKRLTRPDTSGPS